MTDNTDAVRAYILADSDRRDREQLRLLNQWRAGWNAAVLALGDRYEEGFTDGLLALKAAQHAQHDAIQTEARRIIPARDSDYQGGPVAPW